MQKRPEPPQNPELRSIDAQYKRDVAIVTARPKIVTGIFVLWAVVDVALMGFFVFVVLFYLTSGSFVDTRLARTLVDNVPSLRSASVRTAVRPLLIDDAKSLSRGAGKYDVYAEMENPNSDWYATFQYGFSLNEGETASREGFLLPGEKRTFALLNTDAATRPSDPRLVIHDLVWRRVDKHLIPDPAAYIEERANITLDSVEYANDVVVGEETIARSVLTLTNRTAYAYWEPVLTVKLMRGNSIIGLTQVTVPEFRAAETRTLDLRWIGDYPATATVAIEAAINYFDPEVFMNPRSEETINVPR